jgi:hypothetical protein
MTFETLYREIVPDQRIVYTSTLADGDDLITVSLTTVEFSPAEGGTRPGGGTGPGGTGPGGTGPGGTGPGGTGPGGTGPGGGTRLVLTEQGAFLDGREQPAWREQGTADQLEALAKELIRDPA